MTERQIDWAPLLAPRAAAIHASVYPKFGALPEHPDVINFKGGAPAAECLPIAHLRHSICRAWQVEPGVLYYEESEGFLGLRELIAARMARRGAPVSPGEVLVTNGSQQGLELIAKLLLEPGDRVVVEGPTYFGALQIFDIYQATYDVVPMDQDGIDPVALEAALKREPRPKLIYLIPTFQNPAGVSLSPERRRAVIDLSHRYNVPIVEDDPYGELWFERDLGPLRALDPDVLYLGTFSKTLAPALRMGWLAAPPELMQRFIDAKESVDIQSDRVLQRAVAEAAGGGWLDQHLEQVRPIYRSRRDHLLARLAEEMPPGTRWTLPGGGFFVWVTLPGGMSADALLHRAAAEGVQYYAGSSFYPDTCQRPTFRLGFSTLPEERISEGLARLGRVARDIG
ncbi:MAG TPA: PLP-dependent aminotransferase family protein [Thermomicrobiaceae bacterium]|nr:PLP-dependent aminotransferase family protein [Thermomicrobiaceae bacterium]